MFEDRVCFRRYPRGCQCWAFVELLEAFPQNLDSVEEIEETGVPMPKHAIETLEIS